MSGFQILVYVVLGIAGILYLFRKRSRSKNYPPGPWGYPILGHLPRMGGSAHVKCMEWAKKYGPVIAIDFGMFPAIIINDAKLIRAAFNEMEVSGRPNLPSILGRSGGIPEGVIFTSGSKWMEQRRFMIRTLRDFGFGKNSMEGIFHEEIKELIEGLRKVAGTPQSTRNRFNTAVLNALWTLIAGERFKQDDPELQVVIKHVCSNVQNVNVRAAVGNFIPVLAKYAPKLSGFDKLVKHILPVLEFLRKPIVDHKATFHAGQSRDFIDVYLEEISKSKDPTSSFYRENGEKSILHAVFDLFIAGGETTSTTLSWAFLFLAKYPENQKKLQAEISKVVGDTRLPSLTDRPNMPYAEATIHEILRLSSLSPLGVAHNTTNEVNVGGFTIPKDTMVFANYYAVHYDPIIWGDPEVFRPERFLSKDESTFVKNEAVFGFSTGRRVCLGETLARDELFLFMTSLFQAFDVIPAISGEELSVEPAVATVLSPKPHELILNVRN